MADNPHINLYFADSCTDCGLREVDLPTPLPPLGDDFDWLSRDYDSIRISMLEELAARFPERTKWTPADMEVVLVEVLAVMLDQLHDMLDRVQSEAYLSTARRPETVYRLLSVIGFDAITQLSDQAKIPDPIAPLSETLEQKRSRLALFHTTFVTELSSLQPVISAFTPAQQALIFDYVDHANTASEAALDATQLVIDRAPDFVKLARQNSLYRYWQLNPFSMHQAKRDGPRSIHQQQRMVTLEDYQQQLEKHPLVLRAKAQNHWVGSWNRIHVTLVLVNNVLLDAPINASEFTSPNEYQTVMDDVDDFAEQIGLRQPDWSQSPTSRSLLTAFISQYRMAAQPVALANAEFVGINLSLSVRVASHYFRSEVQSAVLQALGTGLGGFFEPGNQAFGEDIFSSDIVEVVTAIEGVEAVCLNRFKRVGQDFFNQTSSGRIVLEGFEVAVCYNDPQLPEMGAIRLVLHGGQRG